MAEPSAERAAKGLWWDKGWTLVEGCTPCSAGCKECWALALEKRMGRAVEGGGIKLRPDRLEEPLHWRKPRVIAVWNDLFHPDVPFEFIAKAYATMQQTPQHTYILLTKRPKRRNAFWAWVTEACLVWMKPVPPRLPNVIEAVTCESNEYLWRVEELVKTPAACRFVNAHLLGPLWFGCSSVPWAGGEQAGGRDYQPTLNLIDWLAVECNRPFRGDPAEWWGWCKSLVEQATAAGVKVWVKQGPLPSGRVSHDFADFPAWARRREFPAQRGADDER